MTARRATVDPAQLALAFDEPADELSDLPAPVGTKVRLAGRRGEFTIDGMHGIDRPHRCRDGKVEMRGRSVRLVNGDNQFVFVRPGEVRLPKPKRQRAPRKRREGER